MNGLINTFVRRPVTVIMILAAITIAAVYSLFNLPVNRLPEISVSRVMVETVYPGMTANELRSMVTIPLEDCLSPIKGLERIRSVSRDNRSLISLDFRWGTDPMSASVLVREAIDAVYPSLPEGVFKPAVTSGDSASEAHAIIAISSPNGNAEFARKFAEYEMKSRLRRIDGVGSVILVGGETSEEKLYLDVHRLAALGLSPSDFAGILAQETMDIPAGNAREGNMELVVIGSGKPDSTASLSQIILPIANGTLRVEDAGVLTSSTVQRKSIFMYNGKEATALEIYRRPDADPLRLSREIQKTIDEVINLFLRDVQIEIIYDSTPSLISGITSLLVSAVFGAGAVVCVLLIFIRKFKYSMLASISIPVSAAMGICILSLTGKSLNSMSIGGLAMGIGLVSDISVIVLDLLHRSFGERKTIPEPEEIGNKAASIAGSSIASTLTTVLVFAPITMLPGPLGSLFGDVAIALVSSVIAGWFYALFCLPSLFRLFFSSSNKNKSNNVVRNLKFQNGFQLKNILVIRNGSFVKKYKFFLSNVLRRPVKLFVVVLLLVFVGFLAILTQPIVFLNPDEVEEVWVSIVYTPGTLLESILNDSYRTSELLAELPFVKTAYGRAGAEEEDVFYRANIEYKKEELILRCILEKGIKPEVALAEIQTVLEKTVQEPFTVFFPKDRAGVLLGLSSAGTFAIKAGNRDELLEYKKITENTFNAASIAVNFRPLGQRPELRLYPNREASAYLSVSAAQIAETLYILNDGIVATRLEIEGRPLDVRITGQYSQSAFIDPISQLEQIPIRTAQGRNVYLGSLGKIERMEADASLARLDRSEAVYVDVPSVSKNTAVLNEMISKYSWFTGADESVFNRYKNSIVIYVLLVLTLLYMTMGAQFESFLLPLILMMSIPFSIAGAGPALFITGSKIDSGAVLGLTALFGLVVNNSLILYEISEQKIRKGLSPAAAVFSGACERLQAILITTTTTVLALMPLIISPLGNSQKSMAAAMLGGLIASTLLSLFAIPPVLIRFFKFKHCSEVKQC